MNIILWNFIKTLLRKAVYCIPLNLHKIIVIYDLDDIAYKILIQKLQEAEESIRNDGTISAEDIEKELELT